MVRVSWASLGAIRAGGSTKCGSSSTRVRIVRYDAQRFNFSDLTEPASPPPEDTESAPLDLSIGRFAVRDGSVRFVDQAVGGELALTHLDATLQTFSLLGSEPGTYNLSAELESGGAIQVDGTLDLAAQTAQAKLSVDALALAAAQPYLTGVTSARVTQGTLGASVAARGRLVEGAVRADPERRHPRDQGPAHCRGGLPKPPRSPLPPPTPTVAKVDLAAQRVEVPKVAVGGLSVEVERRANGDIDLAALAVPPGAPAEGAAPTPEKSAASPAWHYKIGEIALTDD